MVLLYNALMNLTIDDFLGGKVKLAQHSSGYRATSDSVILASAVQAKSGESVLDVGTGSGVILFCLASRINQLHMTGIELQPQLFELCLKNNELNNQQIHFINEDISSAPSVHGIQFHHVVTNPPFYDEDILRENSQQRIAFKESLPLKDWIRFCLKHLRPKGTFTLIHRTVALPEILSILSKTALGGIEVYPLVSDSSKPSKRVLVRGVMGSKKPFSLMPSIVLHNKDTGGHSAFAEAVSRHGISFDDALKL